MKIQGINKRFSPLGNRVLSPNGAWIELQTRIFDVRIPDGGMVIKGGIYVVDDIELEEYFKLRVPTPSIELLYRAIRYFREEIGMNNGDDIIQKEAIVYVTYDQQQGWDIFIPEQEQHPYRVKGPGISPQDKVGMVIHSHGTSAARFSDKDDETDVNGFIYGVVGNLDKEIVKVSLRVGYAGFYLGITTEEVFYGNPKHK